VIEERVLLEETSRPTKRRARGGRLSQLLTTERLVLWGVVLVLLVLVLYPILVVLLRSVQTDDLSSFTLASYARLLGEQRILTSLGNTFVIAIGTTTLATIIGVNLAWINARTNTPGSAILSNLNLIPYFTSSFIGAISWTILASNRNGLINRWAADLFGLSDPIVNIYSPIGIIWVLALFEAPVIYLFTIGAFQKMDPSLEESARVSGTGLIATTLRVTLPLALPSILAAALLVFVTSMGAFEVPLALGIPARYSVLTTELFALTGEFPAAYNTATALSTVLLLITGAGLLIQRKLILRRDYITVTGKGYRPSQLDIGRWRFVALAANIVYLLVAVVMPMAALIASSLQRFWTGSFVPEQLTLRNYQLVLIDSEVTHRGFVNSAILAFGGATIAMAIGVVVAYLVFRTRLGGRAAVDLLSSIPVAVPGVILAIGVMVGWIRTPLYGTIWIMIVAYVGRFIPYAQRTVASTLLSISPELDECSRISGASWLRTMREIILPLLKPGILAGWILLFIIFVRELSMSLFLYRTGTETMSVALYLLQRDSSTALAAFSVIQTALLLLAVAVFKRVSRQGEFKF
jgi:iron(III) transport system permease protein